MLVTLSIELTDLCNARCNYCIIGTGRPPHYGTRLGFLSLDDFRRLLDNFETFLRDPACTPSENLDVVLRYCGIGEPTLHQQFLEFFRIGLEQPLVRRVSVVTNGSYLPPERTERMAELIRQHPNLHVELVLGLDAAEPSAQALVKGIANIHEINTHLDAFLATKRRLGVRNLTFVFQLIVTDENRAHVKSFCDYWQERLDAHGLSYELVGDWSYLDRVDKLDAFIWIKRRDSDDERQPHFDALHRAALVELGLVESFASVHGVPKNVLARHEEAEQHDPSLMKICGLFWYGINVNAAGDVSPCCIDNEFDLKIGNVKTASLRDIYRGEIMQHLRAAHLTRDFSGVPLCQRCTSIYKYKFVSRTDVEKYLTAVGAANPQSLATPLPAP